MRKFFQKNKISVCIISFLISVFPFFFKNEVKNPKPLEFEKYKGSLNNINSIESAENYILEINKKNNPHFDTLKYVQNVENFVQNRFYHGLSTYSFSQNWFANLSGKILWNHMSAVVIPDDLMNYSEGLCSQQSIVFMEILSHQDIKTRHIGWGNDVIGGHFLVEVFYDNSWHLYDVNLEPDWSRINHVKDRKSMSYYKNNKNLLFKAYKGRLKEKLFFKMLGEVKYGQINVFPAKNMRLFHWGSKLVVYGLPILIALIFFRVRKRNKLLHK